MSDVVDDEMLSLTVVLFCFRINFAVLLGTFQLREILVPFRLVFSAVISGALGGAVSMFMVLEAPTFEVFPKLSIARMV